MKKFRSQYRPRRPKKFMVAKKKAASSPTPVLTSPPTPVLTSPPTPVLTSPPTPVLTSPPTPVLTSPDPTPDVVRPMDTAPTPIDTASTPTTYLHMGLQSHKEDETS